MLLVLFLLLAWPAAVVLVGLLLPVLMPLLIVVVTVGAVLANICGWVTQWLER